ncbi:hypothetical protein [Streptomyces sp. NPDC012888]|uniref:hypothetical protein n=1 Tax=Streptomyces sp. NPDC012888 TaxID=3364855 RepID=UPI0036C71A8A
MNRRVPARRPRVTARLTALGAAPLIALSALAPAATAATTTAPAAAAAATTFPDTCHLRSLPADPYHLGCREGFDLGVAAGHENGLNCQKLPPPLSPVNPTPYEKGKRQGYVEGYNQAFQHTYERNCDLPQLPPPQTQPPQSQTPEGMAAAGQAAGAKWGAEDARLTCTREHADLTPPAKPDTLITAYQNGYRVGYDVAYDEAYRRHCMNR